VAPGVSGPPKGVVALPEGLSEGWGLGVLSVLAVAKGARISSLLEGGLDGQLEKEVQEVLPGLYGASSTYEGPSGPDQKQAWEATPLWEEHKVTSPAPECAAFDPFALAAVAAVAAVAALAAVLDVAELFTECSAVVMMVSFHAWRCAVLPEPGKARGAAALSCPPRPPSPAQRSWTLPISVPRIPSCGLKTAGNIPSRSRWE